MAFDGCGNVIERLGAHSIGPVLEYQVEQSTMTIMCTITVMF